MKSLRSEKQTFTAIVTHETLRLLSGDREETLRLERDARGDIPKEERQRLAADIESFRRRARLKTKAVQCVIPSRGVTLKIIDLPKVDPKQAEQILSLAVERELPIDPEEILWTYRLGDLSADKREAAIITLRKKIVACYDDLFGEVGLKPQYAIGSLSLPSDPEEQLTREEQLKREEQLEGLNGHGRATPRWSAVVSIGKSASEVAAFRGSLPILVQSLAWGAGPHSQENGSAARNGAACARLDRLLRSAWSQLGRVDSTPPTPAPLHPDGELSLDEPFARQEIAAGGGVVPQTIYTRFPPDLDESIRATVVRALGTSTDSLQCVRTEIPEVPEDLILRPLREPQVETARPVRTQLEKYALGVSVLLVIVAAFIARYWGPLFELGGLETRVAGARERIEGWGLGRDLGYYRALRSENRPVLEAYWFVSEVAPEGFELYALSLPSSSRLILEGRAAQRSDMYEFSKQFQFSQQFMSPRLSEVKPHEKGGIGFRLEAEYRRFPALGTTIGQDSKAQAGAENTAPAESQDDTESGKGPGSQETTELPGGPGPPGDSSVIEESDQGQPSAEDLGRAAPVSLETTSDNKEAIDSSAARAQETVLGPAESGGEASATPAPPPTSQPGEGGQP